LEQLGQLVRREAGVEPARTKYLDKQRAKGVKLVEAEHFVRIDCSNDGLEDFQLSAPLRCSALEDYVADEASPAPEVEIKLVGDVLCEEHLARVASNYLLVELLEAGAQGSHQDLHLEGHAELMRCRNQEVGPSRQV